MAPAGGFPGRGDRPGRRDRGGGGGEARSLDWSDSSLTDELLQERIDCDLDSELSRLRPPEGAAECAVNLASNDLSGRRPLGALLRRFREAEVRVTCLRLHRNHLQDEALGALIEHFEAVAEGGQVLAELHLSDNHLSEAGIHDLIRAAFRCHERRRGRALWLRAENQRPPIANPKGVLDSLAADGMSVCLLPSKEFQVPGQGKPEAPVHLHHAFVPKTDQRWNAGVWMKGKGSLVGGTFNASASGSASSSTNPAANQKDWRAPTQQAAKQERGGNNGKGRWPAVPPYSAPQQGGKGGYDKGGKQSRPPDGRAAAALEGRWRPPTGRGPAAGGERGWRGQEDWEERDESSPQDASAWEDWPEDEALDRDRRRGGVEDHLQGYGPTVGREHRRRSGPEQWLCSQLGMDDFGGAAGLHQPSPAWQLGAAHPSASSGGHGYTWLDRAAENVRCKINACKNLGMLNRSLNPAAASDHEWMRIAHLGSHYLSRQCYARASIFAGSFVEDDGLQEILVSCVGEVGLAAAFRELRLSRLFTSAQVHDEQDDNQCASLVAAICGDLLDVPQHGESDMRWNARKTAEWALLDVVFLLGNARLVGVGFAAPHIPLVMGGVGGVCY